MEHRTHELIWAPLALVSQLVLIYANTQLVREGRGRALVRSTGGCRVRLMVIDI